MLISERRKQRWQKLEELLAQVQKLSLTSISDRTLQQLGVLYRQTSIDLSLIRSDDYADPQVVIYLNHLVGRAHSIIYSVRRGNIKSIWWFLKGGFAQVVRRNFIFVLIAWTIFLVTSTTSFLAVSTNPKLAYSLFEEDVIQYEEYRLEHQQGEYKGNFTFEVPQSSFVGAIIVTNNLKVDIYSFASGILFCIPCLLILIFNGLMLGSLSGLICYYGYGFDFFSLILTHGVWELFAMFLSSAAGLILGYALIAPGEFSRRDALRLRASEALQMLAGAAVMTIITGIIEAYVTPHASLTVRWFVIGLMTLLLISYFSLAGREKKQVPV